MKHTLARHPVGWSFQDRAIPRADVAPNGMRLALVVACAVAFLAGLGMDHPASYLRDDPSLAHLLQGMALIKLCLSLAAAGAAFWRLGWPISTSAAAGYVVGCAVLFGATALIWQLSFIVFAAVTFHVAAFCLVIIGWREG